MVIDARLAMKEATLLDWTAPLMTESGTGVAVGPCASVARRGQVRNILRVRMLRSNLCHARIRGFARLGESVVSRIEILSLLCLVVNQPSIRPSPSAQTIDGTYFELILEKVFLIRKLAIKPKEALLVGRERLC